VNGEVQTADYVALLEAVKAEASTTATGGDQR